MWLNIFKPYILAFFTIFIAIDIIGNVPLFLSLTEKLSHKQKKAVVSESILYGILITIAFILIAKYLFQLIGITTSDLKMAVGLILAVISINLLLKETPMEFQIQQKHLLDLGLFPLVIPVIFSPTLFAMSFIVLEEFGLVAFVLSLILNMALVWFVLEKSEVLSKIVGLRGIGVFSKILEIILIVISMMWVRQGLAVIFFK